MCFTEIYRRHLVFRVPLYQKLLLLSDNSVVQAMLEILSHHVIDEKSLALPSWTIEWLTINTSSHRSQFCCLCIPQTTMISTISTAMNIRFFILTMVYFFLPYAHGAPTLVTLSLAEQNLPRYVAPGESPTFCVQLRNNSIVTLQHSI